MILFLTEERYSIFHMHNIFIIHSFTDRLKLNNFFPFIIIINL